MNLVIFLAALVLWSPLFCLSASISNLDQFISNGFDTYDPNHPFGDVLVIAHSNYKPSSFDLAAYRSLFSRNFPNLLFYGNWAESDITGLLNSGFPVISNLDVKDGAVAHLIMVYVMKRFQHKNIAGYLYVHDDLVFSLSKVQTFSKKKIWIAGERKIFDKVVFNQWPNIGSQTSWMWFRTKYGLSAVQDLYRNNSKINQQMQKCSGGTIPDTLYYSSGDIHYVPVSYRDNYIEIVGAMANFNVFFEIALSTWLKCFTFASDVLEIRELYPPRDDSLPNHCPPEFCSLADQKAIEFLELCTDWDYNRNNVQYYYRHCPPSTDAVHPVKISSIPGGYFFMRDFLDKHPFA